MRTLGHQQLTTDNGIMNNDRQVVYVTPPIKESKAKEKLLGDTPDRLTINDMPHLLKEKKYIR